MSTKKKLLIAIAAVSVTLVITLVTLIVVLVANSQVASSQIEVGYEATDVAAQVSAKYYVGENTVELKNGSDTTLVFGPGLESTGSLSASGSVNLTPDTPKIIFEYKFVNTDTSVPVYIDLVTNLSSIENAKVSYNTNLDEAITDLDSMSQNTTWSKQRLTANSTGTATLYVYIVIEPNLTDSNASASGSFSWTLTRT